MECASHNEIGKIGSALFIGIVIGCLFIPRLADIYGRKKFVLACHILNIPILLAFFAMKTMDDAIVCYFILGLTFAGTAVVGFAFVVEFLVKRLRIKVVSLIFASNRFFSLFAVVFFRYLSKSWVAWNWLTIVIQCIVIVGLSLIPESPDFYFAKGRYEESKQIVLRIAEFNGADVTADQLKLGEEDESDPQVKEPTTKKKIEEKPQHCKGTIS